MSASGTTFPRFGSAFDGVPADSMSKIPSTAPSFCGVGPSAQRTCAGVGSSSGTVAGSGACRVLIPFRLLLGVAAMALAGLSFKALCSVLFSVVLTGFCGVVCGLALCPRRLSYSLYLAAETYVGQRT